MENSKGHCRSRRRPHTRPRVSSRLTRTRSSSMTPAIRIVKRMESHTLTRRQSHSQRNLRLTKSLRWLVAFLMVFFLPAHNRLRKRSRLLLETQRRDRLWTRKSSVRQLMSNLLTSLHLTWLLLTLTGRKKKRMILQFQATNCKDLSQLVKILVRQV